MSAQRIRRFSVLVGREVIADHDRSRLDLGHQNLADICGEGRSAHCALDDPGRDQLVMRQTRKEALVGHETIMPPAPRVGFEVTGLLQAVREPHCRCRSNQQATTNLARRKPFPVQNLKTIFKMSKNRSRLECQQTAEAVHPILSNETDKTRYTLGCHCLQKNPTADC